MIIKDNVKNIYMIIVDNKIYKKYNVYKFKK